LSSIKLCSPEVQLDSFNRYSQLRFLHEKEKEKKRKLSFNCKKRGPGSQTPQKKLSVRNEYDICTHIYTKAHHPNNLWTPESKPRKKFNS
jgi:hypothetical protein